MATRLEDTEGTEPSRLVTDEPPDRRAWGDRHPVSTVLAPAVVTLVFWEIWATATGSLILPTASETLTRLFDVLGSAELWSSLWVSNQSLFVGYGISVFLGVPLGLLMGRFRKVGQAFDIWVDFALVTPSAVLIPLMIMALGFTLFSRSLLVILFAMPFVIVNSRRGTEQVDKRLIEMARCFGSSEPQIWQKVLLPGSGPAVWAGLRIGLGRAITGMVIVELLMVAVGIGNLMLEFRGAFDFAGMVAVIVVVVAESLLLIRGLEYLEDRFVGWSHV